MSLFDFSLSNWFLVKNNINSLSEHETCSLKISSVLVVALLFVSAVVCILVDPWVTALSELDS
ncbi:hypothetical protein RhiirC2_805362, partial [Rhizophagus irregularis]